MIRTKQQRDLDEAEAITDEGLLIDEPPPRKKALANDSITVDIRNDSITADLSVG